MENSKDTLFKSKVNNYISEKLSQSGTTPTFSVTNDGSGNYTISKFNGDVTLTTDGTNYIFTPQRGTPVTIAASSITSIAVDFITLNADASVLNGETVTGSGIVVLDPSQGLPQADLTYIQSAVLSATIIGDAQNPTLLEDLNIGSPTVGRIINIAQGEVTLEASLQMPQNTSLVVETGATLTLTQTQAEASTSVSGQGTIDIPTDTTPPAIIDPADFTFTDTGSSTTDGITSSGTISLALATDTASWQYSTDGGTTWTNGSGSSFTLSNGTYDKQNIKVKQFDAAGFTGNSSISLMGTELGMVDQFEATEEEYASNLNLDQQCQSCFGDAYRMADWDDINALYENEGTLENFFDKLNIILGDELHVSSGGVDFYSGTRQYFIERQDHITVGGFLVHDDINNKELSLGSWEWVRKILCYTDDMIAANLTIDTTTPTTTSITNTDTNSDSTGVYAAGDKITFAFSESIDATTLTLSDITLNNSHSFGTGATLTALNSVNGFASNFEITLGATPTVAANDTLTIASSKAVDVAGNANSSGINYTVPTITAVATPTFTATNTDGIITFDGTATGNISLAIDSGIVTFTKGSVTAATTVALADITKITLAAGQTIADSAADLTKPIDGAGNVVVTGTAGDDVLYIHTSGTNSITGGAGSEMIWLGDTAANGGVDTMIIANGDSSVGTPDQIVYFELAKDKLDLPSTTIATTSTNVADVIVNGVTVGKTTITNGIATFQAGDDITSAAITSADALNAALSYLGGAIADGDTVAFTYDLGSGNSSTYIFQGGATGDIVVDLVGVSVTGGDLSTILA